MTARVHIARAARVLAAGGIVAYPTEAVFGLGCLPGNRAAVLRLLALKRRSARKGFILIAANAAALAPFVDLSQSPRRAEILASWPGPVTWTLPARRSVPRPLTGGRRTLAVRVTGHAVAAALCERVGGPLVSTSANLSGHRPHTRVLALRRALGARVDYVLAGATGGAARPTAIRDGRTGRVLRAG